MRCFEVVASVRVPIAEPSPPCRWVRIDEQAEQDKSFPCRPRFQKPFREAEFDTQLGVEFLDFVAQPVPEPPPRDHRQVTLIGVCFYVLDDRGRHPRRLSFGRLPSDDVDVRFDLADRHHLVDAGQRHELVRGHDDLLWASLALLERYVFDSPSPAHQFLKLCQSFSIVAAEPVDRLAWVSQGEQSTTGAS